MIFYPESSGQEYLFSLPFVPSSLVFDPQKWLLAKATVQLLTQAERKVSSKSPIKIQPNPFADSLEFDAEIGSIFIRLFDFSGKEVLRSLIIRPGRNRISTAELIPGNYLLLWELGQKSGVEHLIKKP